MADPLVDTWGSETDFEMAGQLAAASELPRILIQKWEEIGLAKPRCPMEGP